MNFHFYKIAQRYLILDINFFSDLISNILNVSFFKIADFLKLYPQSS